jgi:D-sedoheptulose 7-phosphate isomerase
VNGHDHLVALGGALDRLEHDLPRLERWGQQLARVLVEGGRLLAVGNGGSAAQAQHLTAELVGRYVDDRPPFSGIALHADTSALTALVNDYGADEAFARAVRAHGRPGDVLVALSTSGRSTNVLAATAAALSLRIRVLALTGPPPNPLAEAADEAICVAGTTPTVQEVHQVIIHLLCESFDAALLAPAGHNDALNGRLS